MNFNEPYLTEQIITYLGNKRKLLNSIHKTIDNILVNDKDLKIRFDEGKAICYDAFSGSGIVSRLLRKMGFIVNANDLESYAQPINKAFLEFNKDDAEIIFTPVYIWLSTTYNLSSNETSHYSKVIDLLNRVDLVVTPYFSKHYAPANTANPDFENERLFYTQENAKKLDIWATIIHDKFFDNHILAKSVLSASILYVMGKQINTSGVMKGFHNGWGGRSGAALSRIMSPMILDVIPMLNKHVGKAWLDDAEKTLINLKNIDVIYADPPYNQHQYGANYHLLTTFWNNDKYDPGPVVKGSRAGIRTHHNRSLYAQSKEASKAFNSFIINASTNAKYLIVSYNNEGLIPHTEMISLLSQNYTNNVDVVTIKHDKFKGGKATQTSNAVVEYLFVVKFNATQSKNDLSRVLESTKNATKQTTYVDTYVDPNQLKELFTVSFVKKGWILSNPYGWTGFINLDRKISDVSEQPLTEKEHNLLKKATLNKEELLNIYIMENRWRSALHTLRSFKLKRDLEIFKRNAIVIYSKLKEDNNKYMVKLELLYKSILNEDIKNVVN